MINSERLSLRQKIGFGVGDIFGGGSGVIISFYYLYFLTDIIRINPALAGTVILISKIYDAVTDPFEGVLTDRTRTRFGRRRPYLLAGVLFVFLSFFTLWYPVNFALEWQRFAFVIFAYLFFSTVMSIVMTAYNALASELTLDYHERTSISSVRIFFSSAASVLAALLPLEVVKLFPDVRAGYVAMGVIFGVLFAAPFIWTFFATRERPEFQRALPPFNLRETFIEPFRVRSFVSVLLMYLLAFVAMDAVASIVIYYMKYYLLRGGEANYVSGTLLVAQVAALPFYVWLSRRTSKKAGYVVGAAIWITAMLTSFLITPGGPGWAIYAFAAVVGMGTGGIVIMIYAIFPDIPDIDELKTGQRREGTYSALITFMRKFSSAIAIFIVSQTLALSGYVPPVEQVIDGAARIVEQPQSAGFILALRVIFVATPLVFLALALAAASQYRLSPQVHALLSRVLEARRGNTPAGAELEEEAQRLKGLLI